LEVFVIKINAEELELAVQYIKAHSRDLSIKIDTLDGRNVAFTFEDKGGTITEITLYGSYENDKGALQPKIRKSDTLTKEMVRKGTL
jgi:hypothetical protein